MTSPKLYDPRVPMNLWRMVAVHESGCWRWTGSVAPNGYGSVSTPRDGRTRNAHRLFYELLVGPGGPALDHMCHNVDTECPGGNTCIHRRCVNPAHLEVVTYRENLRRSTKTVSGINARKTHCASGHPYDEVNTRYGKNGGRACRLCDRDQHRAKLIRLSAAGLNAEGKPYVIGPYPSSRRRVRP